jgi:diguanylate cyclase (GGDEF)-like protein
MKVLIVDDSEIDNLLCKKIVESLGYNVISVASAKAARKLLAEPDSADIIILDWMMPEMDGIELSQLIRNQERSIDPFILMMTSNSDRHAEAEALNAGADDFISKPINKIDMEAKLKLGRRLVRTQLELLLVNQTLKERLDVDPVTGVMRRQSGTRAIATSLSRLSRQENDEGLLIHCHFRFTNKHLVKHDIQDRVFSDLASHLSVALRQSDILVRFKDDEFLCFAESNPDSHQVLLNRVERAIQQCDMRDYGLKLKMSTLIAGLVIKPEQALTAIPVLIQSTEALLSQLADKGETMTLSYLSALPISAKILSFTQHRK